MVIHDGPVPRGGISTIAYSSLPKRRSGAALGRSFMVRRAAFIVSIITKTPHHERRRRAPRNRHCVRLQYA
jgi:hypothetical protein